MVTHVVCRLCAVTVARGNSGAKGRVHKLWSSAHNDAAGLKQRCTADVTKINRAFRALAFKMYAVLAKCQKFDLRIRICLFTCLLMLRRSSGAGPEV
jgi:hypothetical protein